MLLRTYDNEGNPVHDHVRNFDNNKELSTRTLFTCLFNYLIILNVAIASKYKNDKWRQGGETITQ